MSAQEHEGADETAAGDTTVLAKIHEQLDREQIHGLTVTRQRGETYYLLVASSGENEHGMGVFDLRTVVVDLDKRTVAVTKNGLWVPLEGEILDGMKTLLTRSWADLNSVEVPDGSLMDSVADVDPVELLSETVPVEPENTGQHVDKMRRYKGIDPSRPWGFGAGPPPEISTVIERLEEAGLDPSEHFHRLVWGRKDPMDRVTRPVEQLTGNYGIELLPRDSGLIALDVDYPEEFPENDLPDTFAVSSPHGDDSRRHLVFRCDEKKKLARALGAWAIQSVPWGDLWIGDRYLVGPGSQLSEYGCGEGDHEVKEPGGCEGCEDPEGGFYRIVSDVPIATISAQDVLNLLPNGDDYTLRDEPTAPAVPEEDGPSVREGEPDPPEPRVIAEATLEELRGFAASYEDVNPKGLEPSDLRKRLMALANRHQRDVNAGVNDEDAGEDVVTCGNCGNTAPREAMKVFDVAGDERAVCRGGCDGGK